MSKYSTYSSRSADQPKKKEAHPVWRGVGLAMMVLIPFISYVGAMALIQMNNQQHWFPIPADLLIKWRDPMLLIKVILTIAVAFVLYLVFMLITFVLFRVMAPPRYGPYDVPPVTYKGKKSKR